MDTKYLDYYNLEDIWKQEITLGQVNTINQIIELLEELDVKSILDVGCGNGFLINSLPSDIKVVGMDISEEALKYVKREYVTGSIDDIPFEDNSFDLVVCSDVIEHLYEEVLIKGIDELKRVSKKYLLMIYPYREQLDYSRTKCKKCGCHFHINWHLRSLDVADIKSRINDDNIKLEKVFFSGEEWPIYFGKVDELEKCISNKYVSWENAICPNCTVKQNAIDIEYIENDSVGKFFTKLKTKLSDVAVKDRYFNEIDKNEAMLLFKKEDCIDEVLSNNLKIGIAIDDDTEDEIELSVYDSDAFLFSDNKKSIETCILQVPKRPYFVLDSGSNWEKSENDSLRYVYSDDNTKHAVFVFPKESMSEDREISISYIDQNDGTLNIQVYDCEKGYLNIGKISLTGSDELKRALFKIPLDVKAAKEGYIFEITNDTDFTNELYIKSIEINNKNNIISNILLKKETDIYSVCKFEKQFLLAEKNLFLRSSILKNIKYAWIEYDGIKIFLDVYDIGSEKVVNIARWIFGDKLFNNTFKPYQNDIENNIGEYLENLSKLKSDININYLMNINEGMERMTTVINNLNSTLVEYKLKEEKLISILEEEENKNKNLEVEKQNLEVEKRNLEVEKRNLEVEKQNLEVENQKLKQRTLIDYVLKREI